MQQLHLNLSAKYAMVAKIKSLVSNDQACEG